MGRIPGSLIGEIMTVYAWQLDDNDNLTTTGGTVLDYVGIEQTPQGDANNSNDANFGVGELVYIDGVEYTASPQLGFYSAELTMESGEVFTTNYLFEAFDLVDASGNVTEYLVPISADYWAGFTWTNVATGVTTTSTIGDFFAANGQVASFVMTPSPGDTAAATYTGAAYTPLVTCFVRGTHIEVESGNETKVEDLRVGDLVLTKDHGLQAIKWIGSTTVRGVEKLAPIVFKKGALGNTRELRVSPQHRMLITSGEVELLFAELEALVSAKSLVNDRTIVQVNEDIVEYYHILFDQHEVIFSEGIPSESLYLGKEAIKALSDEARAEILELFPELKTDPQIYKFMDVMQLKSGEANLLGL